MSLGRLAARWFELNIWVRWAVVLWAGLVVGIAVRVLASPLRSHTVFPIYAVAAERWLAGEDPYAPIPGLDFFRYPPGVAAAFVPWLVLPERLAGLLWRGLSVAVFLAGLAAWARWVLPRELTPARKGLLFSLTIPLVLPSLNNGQVNVLLIGLLMLGVAAVARERWNRAALLLMIPVVLKVYPAAVGLMLAAVYPRRFDWRFALAVVAGFALPFLLQRPDYVWDQYRNWVTLLNADGRLHAPLGRCPRDLFLLFRVWWEPPTLRAYQGIQLASSVVAVGVCLAAALRGASTRQVLTLLLNLGCVWMILLGPATEACTYVLLAPTAATLLVAGPEGRSPLIWGLALLGYGLLVCTMFAAAFPGGTKLEQFGPQPAGALLLGGVLLLEAVPLLRRRTENEGPVPMPAPSEAARPAA